MSLSADNRPLLGVLCWEAGVAPRGLRQLELLPGNSTNLQTYQNLCRVHFSRIKGANLHTVLENPSTEVLAAMIAEGQRLVEQEGAVAITTSCGFNAIFQPQLAAAVPVPVFASSLLQVPALAHGTGRKVGVITASAKYLTEKHLRNAGIGPEIPLAIRGLDQFPLWRLMHQEPESELDLAAVGDCLTQLARELQEQEGVGSLLLECTDLPPYAERLRRETGLPVADYVSLVHWLLHCVNGLPGGQG
jgi:Asp/Glu/hydantoin racemase